MKTNTISLSTLLAIVVMGFFSTGSSCDEGADNSLLDSNSGAFSRATGNGPLSTGDTTPTTVGENGTRTPATRSEAGEEDNGTLTRGDSCEQESDCAGGLTCEGGVCVEEGVLRVSIVWDADVDLDIHVSTPLGEELYYRNREGQGGGQFLKDGCIADNCEPGETKIEAVLWRGDAPSGTYEVWAVNYDGDQGANFRVEVRNRGRLETFNGTVAAGNNAASSRFAFSFDDSTTGPGNLKITSHEDEQWVRGPALTFRVDAGDEAVSSVNYKADNRYDLGTSDSGDDFQHSHEFSNLGEREITATGYNDEGFELDNHTITVVVMDENDGLPNPANGAVVSPKLLAKRIKHHAGSINLYPIQVSGRDDGADSSSNIDGIASGGTARNSCYGNAPCGRTQLDAKMLQAMVILRQVNGYTFRVTSIAGGSHSPDSLHYHGRAFDVDTINGRSVSGNTTLARQFMNACRNLGAVEVLGPGNAGHSSHVHCAW